MSEFNVDPMKKSSIYATFGRYYGEKLYKLLYDCCSGRPGSFCYEVKRCLGISETGNPSLVLNQQGDWIEIATTIETTYDNLISDLNNNALVPNAYYEFDFRTVHYIQFSGGGIGNEDIHYGNTEKVKVKALSTNELSNLLESLDFPDDIIYWRPLFQDREWDAVLGQSTGIITSREDSINKNYRDYDFRNVIFRRWETVNGSGIYNDYQDTGFNYQDFTPFPTICLQNKIGSILGLSPLIGVPYYLDNCVFQEACFDNNIDIAVAVNIMAFAGSNNIKLASALKINGTFDFTNNVIGNIADCTIGGDMKNNICSLINSVSIGSHFISNTSSKISDCSVGGEISENQCTAIENNSSSIANASIIGNNVYRISYNSEFDSINYNTGNTINNNEFSGVAGNSHFDNNNFGLFSNNTVSDNIRHNLFSANINGKIFTPTTGMQSSNPSITLWDNTNGDVEQILTAGVLSYTAF